MTFDSGALFYSIAAISCGGFTYLGVRGWLEFKRGQLLSDTRVEELQRDFHLLRTKTQQAIEEITKKTNESVVKIEDRVGAQEMKMGMNGPFSTAGRFG